MFHPDIQKKIHDELDRVVGDGRLPNPDDMPSLKYLFAAYKESQRWRPTAPISMCLYLFISI
jgi:cytochrome P450